MANVPSLEKLIDETERVPNVTLEKAYSELSRLGGFKRFGRVKLIPETIEVEKDGEKTTIPFRKDILEYLRETITTRNIEGDYLFVNRAEQRRLRKVRLAAN